MREARVTAGLEHAGVVPVHDIGVADDGAMYLSMRRVVGDTLAAINERRRGGEDPHGLGSPNQIVNLFLKIAYTLAHAHERGVVHRDIKPENIMLGSFGEVFLVDWGSASDGMDGTGRIARVVGTPLFMSPEQARTEPATVASDIYCLGGTLFETLVGRAPVDVKRGGDFWERKRHGEIDLPSRSERRGVPKRLLAIALKSLAAEPARRYVSAVAFARDLEAYQAGQALTAYRESVVERLVRWWCRHWRTVVVAGLVLGAIGGAAWIVASERLKEWATWGSPAVVETFDEDSSWRRRWQVVTGGAVVQDGVLVTTSPAGFISYFKERMYGPMAIEFTGRIRPDAIPCDLSAVWCENITDFAGASTDRPVYTLKVGGNDNTKATISLNQSERNERFLAQRAHSLEPGRTYHVRAEIDGSHLRVLLDGELAIETWLDVPLPAGHIGLYGWYSGKTFDDVRIYCKDVPERVSPLAIGDAFFQTRQWNLAAMHYGRVIDSHPEAEMAVVARYRQGLCHLRADRWVEAEATWAKLPGGEERDLVTVHRLRRLLDADPIDHQVLLNGLATLLRSHAPRVRHATIGLWLDGFSRSGNNAIADRYRELHHDRFLDDPSARMTAADDLLERRRFSEALADYGEQPTVVWRCLFASGQTAEAAVRCQSATRKAGYLVHLGRFAEVERDWADIHWSVNEARILQGRFDDLVGQPSDWDSRDAERLILSGRINEALRIAGPGVKWPYCLAAAHAVGLPTGPLPAEIPYFQLQRYLAAGHARELAAGKYRDDQQVQLIAALDARGDGDAAGAAGYAAAVRAMPFHFDSNYWFAWFIGQHVATAVDGGDVAAVRAQLRATASAHPDDWAGRLAHACRFIAGDEDEQTFLAQPASYMAKRMLLLCRALRADLAHEPAQAAEQYRAFLAMPSWARCFSSIDHEAYPERLAAWRLRVLQSTDQETR